MDMSYSSSSTYSCSCSSSSASNIPYGQEEIGELYCLDNDPPLSFDYKPTWTTTSSDPVSLTMSHYYDKAASQCYHFTLPTSIQDCQVLGNLCAMMLFDQTSSPCELFIDIKDERGELHGQVFFFLPLIL